MHLHPQIHAATVFVMQGGGACAPLPQFSSRQRLTSYQSRNDHRFCDFLFAWVLKKVPLDLWDGLQEVKQCLSVSLLHQFFSHCIDLRVLYQNTSAPMSLRTGALGHHPKAVIRSWKGLFTSSLNRSLIGHAILVPWC